MTQWDPTTYLQFADERARPFVDLVSRVRAAQPTSVVDLGCGPGSLTASLADRWPSAEIVGLDSSPDMIAQAEAYGGARVSFAVQDLQDWTPREPVDVIVSNAALQWVPGHRELLPRLVQALAPGGWLAFQVPGNFGEASHRLLHELAEDDRFAAHVADRERPASFDAADYLEDLAGLGCAVDAWETTYLHRLTGPDPVFTWIRSTGARPVLQALPDELREQFEVEYKALLAEAYPARPYGTVLPFRRVFVVAQRTADRG
ncbi:MAG TPA: trans-aconitate 2-methyltransferase [Propionibacteriaceae bacterium]|nr:trans-aconitate 2-methyltransferase [Propionibacteriaceae bacterium]